MTQRATVPSRFSNERTDPAGAGGGNVDPGVAASAAPGHFEEGTWQS